MKREANNPNKDCVIIFEDKQENEKFEDSVLDINITESHFLTDKEIEEVFNTTDASSIKKVNNSNLNQ